MGQKALGFCKLSFDVRNAANLCVLRKLRVKNLYSDKPLGQI